MVERGEKGKLKPGSVLNPKGRPKRTEEEQYNSVLFAVQNPERFRKQLEKQAEKADRGDLESFKYLCKLMGLEVDKKEVKGDFGLVISWDDNASS